MMILSNKPLENGQAPKLYPTAVSMVEVEEQKGTSISSREDSLSVSPEAAMKLLGAPEDEKSEEKPDEESKNEKSGASEEKLSEDEQKTVDKLKERDREVRAHEQAHIAAGGAYVRGGASYSYQSGPDGQQYAIGGNVNIDTSPVSGDPDATIAKMQTVRAAALAPAEPSGQDQSVAAAASQAIAQAQSEKAKKSDSSESSSQEIGSTPNDATPSESEPETESSKPEPSTATNNPTVQKLSESRNNSIANAYSSSAPSGSLWNSIA